MSTGAAQEPAGPAGAEQRPELDERARLRQVREYRRAREGLGRSRGGLSTKIHLAADRCTRAHVMILTGGQRGDAPMCLPVLARLRVARPGPGRPRTRPDRVLADKAYASAAIRGHLRRRGIKATIPDKADQAAHRKKRGSRGGRPPAFDAQAYKDRNVVERAINRLKKYRAIAMRTDKRLFVYAGTVHLGMIDIWLHDLTRDP